MKKIICSVSFLCCCGGLFSQQSQNVVTVKQPVFKKDTFNIAQFGARPDGVTSNTNSISNAIQACNKNGGGVVLVPAGVWLTGPLVLLSNVNLCVSKQALLQFTDDKSQYKLVEANYEGLPAYRNQPPLSAKDATGIAITGEGIIDGNGSVWRAVNHDRVSDMEWKALLKKGGVVSADSSTWFPSESYVRGTQVKKAGVIIPGKPLAEYDAIKDFLRPNLLVFTQCKKVLLSGVTFQNSPAWCLHPLMCEDLTVKNITVKNPWYAQNGDGIDVESCTNVLIEGSTLDVGDDGICIKSGKDEEGRKRNMPTQNVEVSNCVVYHAHGGFVIGSEMSGGARNIYVHDCTFIGTDIGLRFKTTRGRGGVVEDIRINNIRMKDILHEAILFDMYYFTRPPASGPDSLPVTEATPQFRDFSIDNVVCAGAARAVFIRGLPEMNITGIQLSNLFIRSDEGIECMEAKNIHFKNVELVAKSTSPLIRLLNSNTITLDAVKYEAADVLLQVKGYKSGAIKLQHTNTGSAKIPVQYGEGVSKSVLSQ